jgi:predicted amidophosphoribosyltransferase
MEREYQRITGAPERVGRNICHHRLSLYGLPCKACGKPLRSPLARLCSSCMAPVEKSAKAGPDVT